MRDRRADGTRGSGLRTPAPALDGAGRKRLADVATTCASESLRLALEAIAQGADVTERIGALHDD